MKTIVAAISAIALIGCGPVDIPSGDVDAGTSGADVGHVVTSDAGTKECVNTAEVTSVVVVKSIDGCPCAENQCPQPTSCTRYMHESSNVITLKAEGVIKYKSGPNCSDVISISAPTFYWGLASGIVSVSPSGRTASNTTNVTIRMFDEAPVVVRVWVEDGTLTSEPVYYTINLKK